MSDYVICTNSQCGARTQCYRYLAWPGDRQRYSRFEPVIIEGAPVCDLFRFTHIGDRIRSTRDPSKMEVVI